MTSLNVPFQFRGGEGRNVLFAHQYDEVSSQTTSRQSPSLLWDGRGDPGCGSTPLTLPSGRVGGHRRQSSSLWQWPPLCAPRHLPVPLLTGTCGRNLCQCAHRPTGRPPQGPWGSVSHSPAPGAPEGASRSSSLSSSLEGAPGSGAGAWASCSCSMRLRRARIRWCRAAYSWPVSLELAWGTGAVRGRCRAEGPHLLPGHEGMVS